ncbi:MAG: head-tail adaptor protein [Alistipes sp.]|nr:head-tail adaptor protein [Alistipes sp.]
MLASGSLTTAIEVLEPITTTSPTGEQLRDWQPKFATRCGTLKRAGRRESIEGNVAPSVTRSIIMRFRPGVTIYDRVRFVADDEVFMIDSTDPDRKNGSLTLHLKYLDE